jgi:hypothetical protein
MPTRYYILNGREVEPVDSAMEWAHAFHNEDRRVALDEIGDYRISTVFLGLDHSHVPGGPPLVFETMVFGPDDSDLWMERCSTYDEAEEMHQRGCAYVRDELPPNSD